METSTSIAKISKALLEAQKEMANAVKDSNNPFFKSKYADLNSVREAVLPALNSQGISLIQPIVSVDGKNYVNTVLLHESGEFISGLTEIIYSKQNDAQSQGSGITYSRRYGMQSMCNIGVEDDDGNNASTPPKQPTEPKTVVKPELPQQAKDAIKQADTIAKLNAIWNANIPLQSIKEFAELISKRRDEIKPKEEAKK